MHCYVKQIIQTLRVNDHRCAFLTNQQSHEEINQLSTVFARSRDYPSRKFAPPPPPPPTPKEKVTVQMQKKQTNVQIV